MAEAVSISQEKTIEHIQSLVNVVGRGGNYLLNIGPKGDGSLVKFEADILRGIGKWMAVNQDAIYGTTMNPFDAELFIWTGDGKKTEIVFTRD